MMHPVLFDLGGHEISAYATFHWVGVVGALVVARQLATRWSLPPARTVATLAVVGLGSFAGARILSALLNPSTAAANPGSFLRFGMGAFHLEGAVIAGVLVAIPLARRAGLALPVFADIAVVAMAVRVALLRVGCFLAGCCFGIETDLPWGLAFPPGSAAWAHRLLEPGGASLVGLLDEPGPTAHLHPTQLYEALAATAVVALVLWLRRRGTPHGVAGLLAAGGFFVFRAADWLLRAATYEAPVWALVAISLGCAAVCVITLLHQRDVPHAAIAG